jgi:acyl-homoserine lactone acylase PvdQ
VIVPAAVALAATSVLTDTAIASTRAHRAKATSSAALPSFVRNGRDDAAEACDVLAPGEFGSVPATANSSDQGELYDALTPLRGNVTAADISRDYLSERFGVQGKVVRVEHPRPGVVVLRDSHDVPHAYGRTRDDVMFGAGWVEYEDRGLLMNDARGPARVAALDVPGVSALALLTSFRGFTPTPQADAFLAAQAIMLKDSGPKGLRVYRDFQDWVAGVNAYIASEVPAATRPAPYAMEDAVGLFAFIGAIFGDGGGNSVASSELLGSLEAQLGPAPGFSVWRDLRQADDPETPSAISTRVDYDQIPGGKTPGSLIVDPGSIQLTAASAAPVSAAPRYASNALLVSAARSATGHPLAVMGPQLGNYYPELFMQLDLHGGGIDAEGARHRLRPTC